MKCEIRWDGRLDLMRVKMIQEDKRWDELRLYEGWDRKKHEIRREMGWDKMRDAIIWDLEKAEIKDKMKWRIKCDKEGEELRYEMKNMRWWIR